MALLRFLSYSALLCLWLPPVHTGTILLEPSTDLISRNAAVDSPGVPEWCVAITPAAAVVAVVYKIDDATFSKIVATAVVPFLGGLTSGYGLCVMVMGWRHGTAENWGICQGVGYALGGMFSSTIVTLDLYSTSAFFTPSTGTVVSGSGLHETELRQRGLDAAHLLAQSLHDSMLSRGLQFEDVAVVLSDDPIVARDLEDGISTAAVHIRGLEDGIHPVHDQLLHFRDDGTGSVRASFPSDLQVRGLQPRTGYEGVGLKMSYSFLTVEKGGKIDEDNAEALGFNIGLDWESRMTANYTLTRYFGKAVLEGKWTVGFQITPENGNFNDTWEDPQTCGPIDPAPN